MAIKILGFVSSLFFSLSSSFLSTARGLCGLARTYPDSFVIFSISSCARLCSHGLAWVMPVPRQSIPLNVAAETALIALI